MMTRRIMDANFDGGVLYDRTWHTKATPTSRAHDRLACLRDIFRQELAAVRTKEVHGHTKATPTSRAHDRLACLRDIFRQELAAVRTEEVHGALKHEST